MLFRSKVRASSSVQVREMLSRIKKAEREGRENPCRRIGILTQGPTLQLLYGRWPDAQLTVIYLLQFIGLKTESTFSIFSFLPSAFRSVSSVLAAVSILQSGEKEHLLPHCGALEIATHHSVACCESMALSGVGSVLFRLIRSCSRSEEHQELLR